MAEPASIDQSMAPPSSLHVLFVGNAQEAMPKKTCLATNASSAEDAEEISW